MKDSIRQSWPVLTLKFIKLRPRDVDLEASVLSHIANMGLYTDVTAKMSLRKNKKNKQENLSEHLNVLALVLTTFRKIHEAAGRWPANILARQWDLHKWWKGVYLYNMSKGNNQLINPLTAVNGSCNTGMTQKTSTGTSNLDLSQWNLWGCKWHQWYIQSDLKRKMNRTMGKSIHGKCFPSQCTNNTNNHQLCRLTFNVTFLSMLCVGVVR